MLGGILRLTGQYRPLLYFGLPGRLVVLAGFGMSVLVVDIFRRTSSGRYGVERRRDGATEWNVWIKS